MIRLNPSKANTTVPPIPATRSSNERRPASPKRPGGWSRRRFIAGLFVLTPLSAAADAVAIEPNSLRVERVRLTKDRPTTRFVHFTDLHYKGNRAQVEHLVRTINAEKPDFVCFTGDYVEQAEPLKEALELLRGIEAPVYAVPGNHDYWCNADFGAMARACAQSGGAFLQDEQVRTRDGKFNLIGLTCRRRAQMAPPPGTRNIVLLHYPAWADQCGDLQPEIMLAGHTHGGQVRLPFIGSLILPRGSGNYDLGMFNTPAGRLYVGAGVGWFHFNIRFNCRPEITVFEI